MFHTHEEDDMPDEQNYDEAMTDDTWHSKPQGAKRRAMETMAAESRLSPTVDDVGRYRLGLGAAAGPKTSRDSSDIEHRTRRAHTAAQTATDIAGMLRVKADFLYGPQPQDDERDSAKCSGPVGALYELDFALARLELAQNELAAQANRLAGL